MSYKCSVCNWSFSSHISYVCHFLSLRHNNNLHYSLHENKNSIVEMIKILKEDATNILEVLDAIDKDDKIMNNKESE